MSIKQITLSPLLITYPHTQLHKAPVYRSALLLRITAMHCGEKANPIFFFFRDKVSREGRQPIKYSSNVEEVEAELCHHLQQSHV